MRDSNVVGYKKPEEGSRDILTEILREGSIKLLAHALEVEITTFIEEYRGYVLPDGKQQIVRNGYQKERYIQTGIGSIPVCVPRTEDRGESEISYESAIIPKYLRKSRSIEDLIPWLYLKGVSTGSFEEALRALLGENAKGLTPSTISRLKSTWVQEHQDWQERDLSEKRYVYWWVDGIHMNARFSDGKQCILVIIGCDEKGNKELVGLIDGYAESEQAWKALLLSLKNQGFNLGPKLAIGDGGLGFWKALRQIFPDTYIQRCWVHKTENVLDKLPQSLQAQAKQKLHAIWMAPTRKEACKAFNHFITVYQAKYPKATECLQKDRDVLLAFYDFPAEHWKHIRTTNPIESTFSTIRLRTDRTRGCLSRETGLAMVFKLCQSAQKRWFKIRGFHLIPDVMNNILYIDGLRQATQEAA